MATFIEGLKITPDNSNGNIVTNGKSEGSNRTSLVSSYQKRHYGTVNKGQWKANGFLVHKLIDSDTLQGIALKYSVPVRVLQFNGSHNSHLVNYCCSGCIMFVMVEIICFQS